MKIIHCSDIHLDSRMERNLPAARARERNAEICLTFGRMIRCALEWGVEAVLISGDLFDTERVCTQTVDFVLDQIRKAECVQFFYLRGNHDENRDVFRGREWPANLHGFGSCWNSYRMGNVVITGLELDDDNWQTMYSALSLQPEDVNLVMLHGQVSTQPGAEQIAVSQLRGKHIRYLALGHIHSYQQEKLDLDGTYCYCGCLEGRGFDECGRKGFVLLEIEDQRLESRFVPFGKRELHEVMVDITGLTTVTEIQSAMEAAAAVIDASSLVKFTLTGSYTLETQKDLRFLKKALEPSFYFVKVKDESRLLIDQRSYEHDVSLKGEFIRMVMASDRTDEEKETIICCGIRALSGEEVAL